MPFGAALRCEWARCVIERGRPFCAGSVQKRADAHLLKTAALRQMVCGGVPKLQAHGRLGQHYDNSGCLNAQSRSCAATRVPLDRRSLSGVLRLHLVINSSTSSKGTATSMSP